MNNANKDCMTKWTVDVKEVKRYCLRPPFFFGQLKDAVGKLFDFKRFTVDETRELCDP